MLTSVQIREAFHVLLLREIGPPMQLALRLKGGVNLRLFFGSVRYSEDMDLDADARLREQLRGRMRAIMQAPPFRPRLRALGVELDIPARPSKDTETVLRHKLGLVVGGVRYPTKVEISFRPMAPGLTPVLEAPPSQAVGDYLEPGQRFEPTGHYDHHSAVQQKIVALASRSEVQARDVFDLAMLIDLRPGDLDLRRLRSSLSDELLARAHDRIFEIGVDMFRDQVADYLAPEIRDATQARWDDARIDAATLLDTIRQSHVDS